MLQRNFARHKVLSFQQFGIHLFNPDWMVPSRITQIAVGAMLLLQNTLYLGFAKNKFGQLQKGDALTFWILILKLTIKGFLLQMVLFPDDSSSIQNPHQTHFAEQLITKNVVRLW
jgi:hypothetical protein